MLVFVDGQRAGSEVTVSGAVVVGRDVGAADVTLDEDPQISRRHASFSPAGAGLTVQDLGSTNGTFVNGQRLTGTVALSSGDRVQLGGTVIEVKFSGETTIDPAPTPEEPRAPAALSLPPNSIEDATVVRFLLQPQRKLLSW